MMFCFSKWEESGQHHLGMGAWRLGSVMPGGGAGDRCFQYVVEAFSYVIVRSSVNIGRSQFKFVSWALKPVGNIKK